MIKAVIIDDEKDARFLLRNMIEKKLSDKIELLGEADDVDTGLELVNTVNPELIFLDVQMKSGTGFDLLLKLGKETPDVIFVTAYDQYAVKAFQFSTFGYVLKPIKFSELESAVEKLEDLKKNRTGIEKKIKVLVENYGINGDIQKLIIPNMNGFDVVEIPSIIKLEGDRNYTHFTLVNGMKVTTSKNLGEYEEMLVEFGFYRIHQSSIVSLRHVKSFKKANDGTVELVDGSLLKVSRNRKQGFITRFLS